VLTKVVRPVPEAPVFVNRQEISDRERTGQHEVVAVDRTRHGMSRGHSD
jgi:hypothetical protein